MKPIRQLLALSAVVLVSCSSTRQVTLATAGDDINQRALDAPARVCFKQSSSGRVLGPFDAINFRIGVDSATWIDQRTLELRSTATEHLVSVEFPQGSAAVQGLGIGFLGGALVGAAGGFLAGDDRRLPVKDVGTAIVALFTPRFTAGEKALMYGSLTGLAGGLGGLIVGATVERYDRYELQPVSIPRGAGGIGRPRLP